MTSATAGWEIARTAWRDNRRRGLAFAVALGVNVLVILGFVASIHSVVEREARAITVMIVPPFVFSRPKAADHKTPPPPTQTARVHEAPPTPAPKPLPAPLPPTPVPKLQPAAPGKWTPTPDLRSRLDDQPSAQRYLRAGNACATGELWKLSREEQDKCLTRWGRVMPKDEDGMHRHPPPSDPGGEFARAVAAQEAQARPMQSAPSGQCDIDVQGSNLHRVCHDSDKGSLVQKLEGQH
jgi:hypothetical protein